MSAVIETNKGEICGICHEKFEVIDQRLTHVGGERHDGFHRKCLVNWVIHKPTCPYDHQPIDPNSFISRTERIMIRLRPALISAAYAGCFGTAMAAIGTVVAGTAGAIVVAGGGAEVAAAATVAGVVTGAVVAGAAITVGAIAAGAAAGAIAAGTAITVGGVVAGIGINWILNRRKFDQIACENIGLGIQIGSLAGVAAASFGSLAELPTIAFVGGVAAGILSLIRG